MEVNIGDRFFFVERQTKTVWVIIDRYEYTGHFGWEAKSQSDNTDFYIFYDSEIEEGHSYGDKLIKIKSDKHLFELQLKYS